jgi:hypothetical protein
MQPKHCESQKLPTQFPRSHNARLVVVVVVVWGEVFLIADVTVRPANVIISG